MEKYKFRALVSVKDDERIVEVPGFVMSDEKEDFRANVAERVFNQTKKLGIDACCVIISDYIKVEEDQKGGNARENY